MGIDNHNLNFLAVAADLGVRFERTLAIGRQAVHVEPRLLKAHRARRGLPAPSGTEWFEPLLHEWGPRRADSRELLTPEPTLSWLSGRRLSGCMAYLQTETF